MKVLHDPLNLRVRWRWIGQVRVDKLKEDAQNGFRFLCHFVDMDEMELKSTILGFL